MSVNLINISTPNREEFIKVLMFLSCLPEINIRPETIGTSIGFDIDRPYIQLKLDSKDVRYGTHDSNMPEMSIIDASTYWLNSFGQEIVNKIDVSGNKLFLQRQASFVYNKDKWVYFELDPEINLTFI